ncbi:hypothetical protein RUND412_003711 [Rhizina undulata]
MPDFKKLLILILLLISYVSFTIFSFITLPSRTADTNSLHGLFFYVLAYAAGSTYYLSENLLITLLANHGRPVDIRPARIRVRMRGRRSDAKPNANANANVNVDAFLAASKNTPTKQKFGAGDPGFLDAYPCDAPGNAPKNTPTKQKLGAGDPGFFDAYPCPPPLRAGDPGFLDAYLANPTPPTPATPVSDSRLYMLRRQKLRNMRTAFIANSLLAKKHTKNGSAEKGKGKKAQWKKQTKRRGRARNVRNPSPPRFIFPERKKMVSPEERERVRVEQVTVKLVTDVEYWKKYEVKREDLKRWKLVVEGKEREMRKRLGNTVDKRKVDGSTDDDITVEAKNVNQNDLVENNKDEKHTGDEKESDIIIETGITEEKTSEGEKKAFNNNGIDDENTKVKDNKNTEDIKLKQKNAE